ncbi:hypothetical protein PISMIDRAFT_685132 [Pisolithus microcarpus 441]|uniref:Uncharacterized protein n=1 Tax=Pisolithus microcarpus 441 TaxID=765257 RepID=A0A0C9YLL7_9AGAM|nr:hypothetical protein PISMIDRAFT_685132 [Pisolithus microcarpus 441]
MFYPNGLREIRGVLDARCWFVIGVAGIGSRRSVDIVGKVCSSHLSPFLVHVILGDMFACAI